MPQSDVNVWFEVARQIPALAALIWLVFKFLAHSAEQQKQNLSQQMEHMKLWKESKDDAAKFMGELAHGNKEVVSKLDGTLQRNTEMIGQAIAVIGSSTTKLQP